MLISNFNKDFDNTVRELSNSYEENSLLCKLSDIFACRNVNEIYENLVIEAAATLGVATTAVLFLDENNTMLHTKACYGIWEKNKILNGKREPLLNIMKSGMPVVFNKINEIDTSNNFYGLNSALFCPLTIKGRTVGLMILADKITAEAFYPSDIKLFRFIVNQAALAIENKILYQEIEDMMLGTIKSFVNALESTAEWTSGHAERVMLYSHGIANEMGIGKQQTDRLRICSLLHDIGKIAIPPHILNKKGPLDKEEWGIIKTHPTVGVKILSGLKTFDDILDGIKYHHEHWNGENGIFKLERNDIPLISRILTVSDAFDAMTSDRPYRDKISEKETLAEIKNLSKKQFDPQVVEALLVWISQQHQAS
ncbi:MAG: HD domain-containing protein [Nitrospiraceae bacterium]|nr:HD domain-containing protein [Nitrospiraceae bacterium]